MFRRPPSLNSLYLRLRKLYSPSLRLKNFALSIDSLPDKILYASIRSPRSLLFSSVVKPVETFDRYMWSASILEPASWLSSVRVQGYWCPFLGGENKPVHSDQACTQWPNLYTVTKPVHSDQACTPWPVTLLAIMVAEISRGSQIFGMLP